MRSNVSCHIFTNVLSNYLFINYDTKVISFWDKVITNIQTKKIRPSNLNGRIRYLTKTKIKSLNMRYEMSLISYLIFISQALYRQIPRTHFHTYGNPAAVEFAFYVGFFYFAVKVFKPVNVYSLGGTV